MLLEESLTFLPHGLYADIVHSEYKTLLKFEVILYYFLKDFFPTYQNFIYFYFFLIQVFFSENNQLNFKINERLPLKRRFEVQDVILNQPSPAK